MVRVHGSHPAESPPSGYASARLADSRKAQYYNANVETSLWFLGVVVPHRSIFQARTELCQAGSRVKAVSSGTKCWSFRSVTRLSRCYGRYEILCHRGLEKNRENHGQKPPTIPPAHIPIHIFLSTSLQLFEWETIVKTVIATPGEDREISMKLTRFYRTPRTCRVRIQRPKELRCTN